ncbi:hypothetical protein AXG93_2587s1130 [Marchantia polymorpha subsp. ruderalis]|uniref:Uncharacterized protein n=1 Tax=Marchantia polymorpha subsp. ruderalis TaxID=1480154 RepID=A0A176WQJ5_MARPO|nr:hypothetical protein AXG93_2587s1130 [Marchantia polymorpha subsp. ruderalis]
MDGKERGLMVGSRKGGIFGAKWMMGLMAPSEEDLAPGLRRRRSSKASAPSLGFRFRFPNPPVARLRESPVRPAGGDADGGGGGTRTIVMSSGRTGGSVVSKGAAGEAKSRVWRPC